jgi:hypothetical protein
MRNWQAPGHPAWDETSVVEAVLAASFKRDGDRPVSPDLVRQHVGDLQQTRLADTPSRRPAH